MIVGGGDKGEEIAEEIGDGDDLVTFIRTDGAGFTT